MISFLRWIQRRFSAFCRKTSLTRLPAMDHRGTGLSFVGKYRRLLLRVFEVLFCMNYRQFFFCLTIFIGIPFTKSFLLSTFNISSLCHFIFPQGFLGAFTNVFLHRFRVH